MKKPLDKTPKSGATTPDKKVAVALRYDNEGAPTVTAKGTGSVAERIEEIARESGVPIEQDPMMAEALSQIDIDEEIPIELYQAVAVLIGFVMRTGKAQHPPENE